MFTNGDRIKKIVTEWVLSILLLLMFFAAMNFRDKGYSLFFHGSICFFVLNAGIKRWNLSAVYLLILAFAIAIFGDKSTQLVSITKCFIYFLCYYFGYHFLRLQGGKTPLFIKENNYQYAILFISWGLLIHLALNFIIYDSSIWRNTIDFWTRTPMSATGQAMLGAITIGISVALLFSAKKWLLKLISILSIALVLAYNFVLAGRMLIFLTIGLFLICVVKFFICCKNPKKIIIAISVMAAFLLLTLIAFAIDFMGLRSTLEATAFYKRFFGDNQNNFTEDPRLQLKWLHFKNMYADLWGGGHSFTEFNFAHDIIFDTYSYAGIFALFGMLGYLLCALCRFFKCMKNRKISGDTKLFIFCLYASIGLFFLVEPIMLGWQWFFVVFCLIDGMTTYLLERAKEGENGNLYEAKLLGVKDRLL